MNSKSNRRLLVLFSIVIIFMIGGIIFGDENITNLNNETNENAGILNYVPMSSGFWADYDIFIDDNGGQIGSYTWAQYKSIKPWLTTGDGSWGNPYILENITFSYLGGYGSSLIIQDSDVYFIVRNCTFINSNTGTTNAGLKLVNTTHGRFENNSIQLNPANGIYMIDSDNNTFTDTNMQNNTLNGVLLESSNNNTFTDGKIKYNLNYGIYIDNSSATCDDNLFYNLYIKNPSGINAYGNGTNDWDNTTIGNYWHDYGGNDFDDDGIGDTPYILPAGSSGAQDNYPIWDDGPDIPQITINSPNNNTYWANAPDLNIDVVDTNPDSLWYNVSDQQEFLQSGITESLRSDIWNGLPEGQFIIELYANDTAGNLNDMNNIVLYKDTINPELTVNFPANQSYWNVAPTINVGVIDANIEYIWYNVSNQQEFLVSGVGEPIRTDIWNGLSEGQFIVKLYANDSAGNINDTFSLELYKDTTTPDVTVNSPGNYTVWSSAPSISITATDTNLEYIWYNISDQQEFLVSGVGEAIRGDIWSGLPEGQFTVEIYANDSAGNINNTFTLSLVKDTRSPDITINLPGNNTYWSAAPTINIIANDPNLEYLWYNVSNQQEFLQSGLGEPLRADIWSGLPQGQFTIEIYANDTAGRLNDTYTLELYKDTITPLINIISPGNNTQWDSAPTINVVATDTNLKYLWYNVSNQQEFLVSGAGEVLRGDIWSGLPEGQFTVEIYANDSAGNINNTFTLLLVKDTIAPAITINSPINNTFWAYAPIININAIDPNLAYIWYNISNNKEFLSSGVGELLRADIWTGISEGQFTIEIYANDTVGRLNNTYTLVLTKDTIKPNVTIVIPIDNQEIGIDPPFLNFTITEINLDTSWYTLNGGENISFTANGTMDQPSWQDLWNSLSHGDTITIRLYANDTAGNIGYHEVTIKVNNPQNNDDDNDDETSPPGGIWGYDIFLFIGILGIISLLYLKKKTN